LPKQVTLGTAAGWQEAAGGQYLAHVEYMMAQLHRLHWQRDEGTLCLMSPSF